MFLGDKVLSYNGYLRFGVQSNGDQMFSESILVTYPLVFMQVIMMMMMMLPWCSCRATTISS